ncbi:MAG: signal recognition particle-docking protein FtsY [Alkalispirochaetaceae bacterium]
MAVKKGLGERLKNLFNRSSPEDQAFYEELEDLLIEADIGSTVTFETVEALKERAKKLKGREQIVAALRELLGGYLKRGELTLDADALNIILVLGVNGVGKTTTIAKLAEHFRRTEGTERIVLAAADTFRAAAVEQLVTHGERLGFRVVRQGTGSDAAAVVFDALDSATSRQDRLVLIDTAGRMHNKANLVQELAKIDKIVKRKAPTASYRSFLVVDATTGQNALRQAQLFHEAVGVDALVMAKYDSSARGGVLIPIARELGIPCAFLGDGEGYTDLRPFDPDRYLQELTSFD